MGLLDRPKRALADIIGKELEPTIAKSIYQVTSELVKDPALLELRKEDPTNYPLGNYRGVRRYQQDFNGQDLNMRRKPGSGVSFQILRQFSVTHEITRACINLRKREITQLEWDIVAANPEDKKDYSQEIDLLTEYFKNLGGFKVRLRALIDQLIEDIMSLDAIALYRERTRNGQPLYYVPLDPATIKLRVEDSGAVPEPPEIAYKQIVRGEVVAELTTDDLIYDMMNSRSNTPYGLAPLESLIIIVSTNLKSNLYNLNYLTDGNIPEGLFAVPSEWSPQQIREYQEVWDAYLAGDSRATSRMRFVPGGPGTSYTPTKKPTDMAFADLNEYIMQVTCAMFDVTPQEIGFTRQQSTRANASEQSIIQQRKGTLPLANFLKELFTDIIQHDLGIDYLAFEFLGLEDHDAVSEAQARQTDIFTGVRTVDEYRKELGLDPLGIDRPFVVGQAVALDAVVSQEAIQATLDSKTAEIAATNAQAESKANPNTDKGTEDKKPSERPGNAQTTEQASQTGKQADAIELGNELRKLRTYAAKRLKEGKRLREFQSDILPKDIVVEINDRLSKCSEPDEVRSIVDEYRQDFQVEFIKNVVELKDNIDKVLQ